jgi:dTDP-4-dehydrorhamnose 3,5-epimerase-like enzyme
MQDPTRESTVTSVKTEEAKKVMTYDLSGNENGFLIELFKDDRLTELYLTAAKPGAFKGYHEHTIRGSRYVCIKGTMKIILYVNGKREEHILDDDPPKRLYIPPHVPTGLENIGNEEAWLINYPDPPYDPELKDEQIDYTQEQLEEKFGNE